MLRGAVAKRLREVVREICKAEEVDIIRGHIGKDHVHLLVSIPPSISLSRFAQRVKGKSARKLLGELRHLSRAFWGRHLWGRGYFVASSGNVTEEVMKRHIENQLHEPEDAEFKIETELD